MAVAPKLPESARRAVKLIQRVEDDYLEMVAAFGEGDVDRGWRLSMALTYSLRDLRAETKSLLSDDRSATSLRS